jgi:hypothetical protein
MPPASLSAGTMMERYGISGRYCFASFKAQS